MSNHYKQKPESRTGFEERARMTAEETINEYARTHVVAPAVRDTINLAVERIAQNPYSTMNDVKIKVREILKNEGREKLDIPVARKVEPTEAEKDKFGKGKLETTIILHTTGYLSNYGIPLSADGFNSLTEWLEGKKPKSYDELNKYLDRAMAGMGYNVGTMEYGSRRARLALLDNESPKAIKNGDQVAMFIEGQKGKLEETVVEGKVAKAGPAEEKRTMEEALLERGVDYEANRAKRNELKAEYDAMGSGKGLKGQEAADFFERRVELLGHIAALDKELLEAMKGIRGEFKKDRHFASENARVKKESDATKEQLGIDEGKERRAVASLGAAEKKEREAALAAKKAEDAKAKKLAAAEKAAQEREARRAERERRAAEREEAARLARAREAEEKPAEAAMAEEKPEAEKARKGILDRLLGAFATKTPAPKTSEAETERARADLEAQVRGQGVQREEARGALSGPAGAKGAGEAVKIEQLSVRGGDMEVKTQGPGEEKAVTARKRAARERGEAEVAEAAPSQEAKDRLDKKALEIHGVAFSELVKSQQREVQDIVMTEIKSEIRMSTSLGQREPQNKAAYDKDIERSRQVLEEVSRVRLKTT